MEKESATLFSATGKGRTVLRAFGIVASVILIFSLFPPTEIGRSTTLAQIFAYDQCIDPCVPGNEDIMKPKAHGTSEFPVQHNLRWDCDWNTADRICNFNRHYAEFSGYWQSTSFLSDVKQNIEEEKGQVTFYDTGWTGSPLFTAPVGRSWENFIEESKKHGWPSFRDSEVDWDYARVLPSGEMVSIYGTHLGHNIPDGKGNRYCINLVSIAGNPPPGDSGSL